MSYWLPGTRPVPALHSPSVGSQLRSLQVDHFAIFTVVVPSLLCSTKCGRVTTISQKNKSSNISLVVLDCWRNIMFYPLPPSPFPLCTHAIAHHAHSVHCTITVRIIDDMSTIASDAKAPCPLPPKCNKMHGHVPEQYNIDTPTFKKA
jgi:hypothetical protein